ncbi:unnamed protein product, partial [marine sediment metagenome]
MELFSSNTFFVVLFIPHITIYIFLADTLLGYEFNQKYKRVRKGDLVYNPYRVNIGSIGIVPSYLDGMLVSPAYVVFRPKSND